MGVQWKTEKRVVENWTKTIIKLKKIYQRVNVVYVENKN